MIATTPVRTNRNATKYGYTTPEGPSNRDDKVPGAPRKRGRDDTDIPFALVLFPEGYTTPKRHSNGQNTVHGAPWKRGRDDTDYDVTDILSLILFPGDDYDSELDGSDTDSELGGYDSELGGYDSELDGYDLDSELDGYYADIELVPLFHDLSFNQE